MHLSLKETVILKHSLLNTRENFPPHCPTSTLKPEPGRFPFQSRREARAVYSSVLASLEFTCKYASQNICRPLRDENTSPWKTKQIKLEWFQQTHCTLAKTELSVMTVPKYNRRGLYLWQRDRRPGAKLLDTWPIQLSLADCSLQARSKQTSRFNSWSERLHGL